VSLEIVWRNPAPPTKSERRVEPVAVDDFGGMYAVRAEDETATFELILGASGLGARRCTYICGSARMKSPGHRNKTETSPGLPPLNEADFLVSHWGDWSGRATRPNLKT
jgi:hypothetical protein